MISYNTELQKSHKRMHKRNFNRSCRTKQNTAYSHCKNIFFSES